MQIHAVNGKVWINGRRVWPRKRRSWLAVLRRWRRMYPSARLWLWHRPVIVQIIVDTKDGGAMIQRFGARLQGNLHTDQG